MGHPWQARSRPGWRSAVVEVSEAAFHALTQKDNATGHVVGAMMVCVCVCVRESVCACPAREGAVATGRVCARHAAARSGAGSGFSVRSTPICANIGKAASFGHDQKQMVR